MMLQPHDMTRHDVPAAPDCAFRGIEPLARVRTLRNSGHECVARGVR